MNKLRKMKSKDTCAQKYINSAGMPFLLLLSFPRRSVFPILKFSINALELKKENKMYSQASQVFNCVGSGIMSFLSTQKQLTAKRFKKIE